MRILVYEHLTGGGMMSQKLSSSLLAEGSLMVQALVRDLLATPGVAVSLLLDRRIGISHLALPAAPHLEILPVSSEDERATVWHRHLARCDAAWVIAPETGGILEQLCRDVAAAGTGLLTCPAEAVLLTADKAATAARLAAGRIPVVPTERAAAAHAPDDFPVVVKPNDGAGSTDCRIIRDRLEWNGWLRQADPSPFVVQPWLAGDALSLSVLFNRGEARLISCNRQHLREARGRLVLEACTVNAFPGPPRIFEQLAAQIATAIPELWGYAGVDLIVDDRGATVLEINPRLTTSYAGLRSSLDINVARWVIDLWRGGKLPEFIPHSTRSVRIETGASDDD